MSIPQAYSPYLESTVRMLGSEHTWQGDKEEESTDLDLGKVGLVGHAALPGMVHG